MGISVKAVRLHDRALTTFLLSAAGDCGASMVSALWGRSRDPSR
jgi:hypothetical protein